MNALIFDFDGEPVRFLSVDGKEGILGSDAARCLGIANPRDVFARTPVDEKGVGSIDTPGGRQEAVVLFEAGLYRLIFESRKPAAERFKTWVFNEVLPTIRRTSGYGCVTLDAKATTAALALVRQAQMIFGEAKARAVWRELGLPDPEPLASDLEEERPAPSFGKRTAAANEYSSAHAPEAEMVADFLGERYDRDANCRVAAATLHGDYSSWAAERGRPPLSMKAFSVKIRMLGLTKQKSNSVWYHGVRLKRVLAALSEA